MIVISTHDSISPIRGGGALRTTKVAGELARRKEDVLLIAPSESSAVQGVPVVRLPLLVNSSSLVQMLGYSLRLFRELVLRRKQITAVWAHNAASGLPAMVFCKIFRKKFIADITDIHTEYMRIGQTSKAKLALIAVLNKLEYFCFRSADRVIAVTDAMKSVFVQHKVPPEKISVIYDGVDVETFANHQSVRLPTMTAIHHGGMEKQDGVHYIVEAACILEQRGVPFHFIVGGGGKNKEALERMTAEKGVADRFTFTGWVEFSELLENLSKAHVGIVSRPDNLPNNTVITLKLLEYWAAGLVPVVPNLAGIAEVSADGEDVLLFTPDSPESMADKLEYLALNPERCTEMSRSAEHRANAFAWDSLIREIVDVTLDEARG